MNSGYPGVKAIHIVLLASGFAGPFCLPRLFFNPATVSAGRHAEREWLLLMARKLDRFPEQLIGPALAGRVVKEVPVPGFASIVALFVVKHC